MNNNAFTLIELLIVIAIIGLLASAVLVSFPGAMAGARDGIRKQDLSTIRSALEEYWDIYGHYPPEDGFISHSPVCTDTSVGCGSCGCTAPEFPNGDYWGTDSNMNYLVAQGSFGKAPIDPINNSTYYYQYEPNYGTQGGCQVGPHASCEWTLCCRLETTGANYCVYSVRNSDDFPKGGY